MPEAADEMAARFLIRQDGRPVDRAGTYDEALGLGRELKLSDPEALVTVWNLTTQIGHIISNDSTKSPATSRQRGEV